MSEGGKGRRQKQRLYISEIAVCGAEAVLFSALTVTATILPRNPPPIHIHHTPPPTLINNRNVPLRPALTYQWDILPA